MSFMSQSSASSASMASLPTSDASHDEGYDLFGTSSSSLGAAAEPLVLSGESSPSTYTLFPMASEPQSIDQAEARKASLVKTVETVETVDDDFDLFPTAENKRPPLIRTHSEPAVSETLDTRLHVTARSPAPPQFKNSGNAVDIIAVRSTEDLVFTSSWHVMFSWSRFRSNITTGVGDMVRVLVNGKELPTKMQLLERGRCTFVTGGLTPPKTDLLKVDLFDDRPNLVRFEHFQRSSDTIRYVESRLHLWGPNESVVVADLDGTLTISDVEGHIRTLRLGQYDFLHHGACDFFNKLHELDMRIIYLTARPLDWASASRTHLENAKQQTHALPPGVLITNSNGLTGALMTEVVNKNPHVFKAQVLNEIQLTLIHAGRVVEHPVFVAGFGNRPTDVVAYEQVGIDPALIFLIDPYSNLKATTDPRIYESYSDPNSLLWLLPKLKHKVPLEKVARIDDYTVRELVYAEDRELLLMAEREARRLQEEEYEQASRRQPSLPAGSSARLPMYGAYAQ
ncbi:hypothetical protein Poli38472_013892 [Pythium oligandrum]|uniref:LNS2/PITP domain-containing protein n=1 Tax=Pythium oligandrum TaxID=41045 RepID=A0A8K1C2A8_PYTOL|nr:hypothetical protein Poli38472_013892 [Pythium oligandrum]|eukprot:TMW55130.1 hypothetical protein Poli38472_013892 [Pythium oligandrum]